MELDEREVMPMQMGKKCLCRSINHQPTIDLSHCLPRWNAEKRDENDILARLHSHPHLILSHSYQG